MKRVIYHHDNQKLWVWDQWASDATVDLFLQQIPWQQNSIQVFGKMHLEPRLTAWFGPAYQYANVRWPQTPWPQFMLDWQERMQRVCGSEFNAVLCNLYRSGNDAMGWHADNEPEIDPACIASLSFGASRTFKIKQRKGDSSFDIELQHGTLLVMENMQSDWLHAVPRRLRVSEPRINFTFRKIVTP